MSVRRLLAEVDSRELAEWQAFDRLDPIGQDRDDWRAGIVAATVANRSRGKGERAYSPADFVPDFDPQPPTHAELAEKVKLLALAWGAEVATDGRNLSS